MQCFLQLRKTFIFSLGPTFLGSQSHSLGAGAGGDPEWVAFLGRRRLEPQGGRPEGQLVAARLCPHQAPPTPAVARGSGTHLATSRPGSPPPPPPPPPSTSHSSRGASLTAPHEIIIHYVTRREVRECKCLDGIRGNPRRDDLGAVIIHLIGAWGKLLDRELELNHPRKSVRQGCVGELASLAIFKRFHLRMRHKMRYYFIHLLWWPLAFLCMNIKFEMAAQQHILESVLWAVICTVGLVSRLLTF